VGKLVLLFGLICVGNLGKAQNFSKFIDPNTGLLIVKNNQYGIKVPWKKAITSKIFNLAPIQSFIYKDGTHSDTSINLLRSQTKAYAFDASIVIETEKQLTIQILYKFKKPKFIFGKETYKDGDAGEGYYKVLITLWANSKTITIEEDLTYDVEFAIGINNGLNATNGRYRGFMADTKEDGYEPDGQIYRRDNERGYAMDAIVDLNFNKAKLYSWFIPWSAPGIEVNTGRYWQLYNNDDSKKANLFGFYQGKPSKLLNAVAVGPRIKTFSHRNGNNAIELQFELYRRGPDNSFYPRKRWEWNAFIGTKEDLKDPKEQQNIGTDFNYYSGLASRIKSYADRPIKLSKQFYDGAIYQSKEQMQELIKKIKTNDSFYNYVISIDDGLTNAIWKSWRDTAIARKNIKDLIAYKNEFIMTYIKGDGPYSMMVRYSYGVRMLRAKVFLVSCLFADKAIKISPIERKELEALVGLIARVLWDSDTIPIQENSGASLANANMIHQYKQAGLYFFSLLASQDDEFIFRAKEAYNQVEKELEEVVYPNGSAFGSPHYIGAALEGPLLLMLQLKQLGYTKIFGQERVKKFARFYMSLCTPESVRFNGNRKVIGYGDGTEESSILTGLLASGFSGVDQRLSDQLYSLYYFGPARPGFHASTPLVLNLSVKSKKNIPLTSCSYDGYMSHCRIAANSNKESALWCINGNGYFDHRNDDASELNIYALGAPLSLTRNSFYSPRADAAHIRSMVIPEEKFKHWASKEQPIDNQPMTWDKTELVQYTACNSFVSFTTKNTLNNVEWFRKVITISLLDSTPIFIIYDSVVNSSVNIWSLPMFSKGAIQTPRGAIEPIKKNYYYNKSIRELPQGTTQIQLPTHWNTYNCVGQNWNLHPTNGIDWQIITYSTNSTQMSASSWANYYAGNMEQNEFKKTNGEDYSEIQQYLRIKFQNVLTTVIIPKLKNQSFPKVELNLTELAFQLEYGQQRLSFSKQFFQLSNNRNTKQTIGVFTTDEIQLPNGFSSSKGPLEIVEDSQSISILPLGATNNTIIKVPFKVALNESNLKCKLTPSNRLYTLEIEHKKAGKNIENGMLNMDAVTFKKL
jgi:hypothetical protein